MHYTVYKITNLVNNKIYVGIHQTENIDDNYMGSGILIQHAIKKYGIHNFRKEYLAIFDNPKDMYTMESEIVNETFTQQRETYNLKTGGYGGFSHMKGTVTVKDKEGNTCRVSRDDPRYTSGVLISENIGNVIVKDKENKHHRVSVSDPKYLSGELVSHQKGMCMVRDTNNNVFRVSVDDPRYLSGELINIHTGYTIVKNSNGDIFAVLLTDPRYISGELVGVNKGYKHSEETKLKISQNNKLKLSGKGNSQYNTVWIYNLQIKQNRKIKKEDLNEWLDKGWVKGRKMIF